MISPVIGSVSPSGSTEFGDREPPHRLIMATRPVAGDTRPHAEVVAAFLELALGSEGQAFLADFGLGPP
jgi:hypothetical protein